MYPFLVKASETRDSSSFNNASVRAAGSAMLYPVFPFFTPLPKLRFFRSSFSWRRHPSAARNSVVGRRDEDNGVYDSDVSMVLEKAQVLLCPADFNDFSLLLDEYRDGRTDGRTDADVT